MSWRRDLFIFNTQDKEREELKRLCKERNAKLKPGQMPTIITDQEMDDRRKLSMNCTDYITLTDFRKKTVLENDGFIHRRKTLQQELDDKGRAPGFDLSKGRE